MRLTRVHVDAPLRSGQRLTIEGSAGNHIARVLRLRADDCLTLFNGQGGEYGGSIEEIRRDTVLVSVLEHREFERESPFQLVLAQGISRADRMDWVVQKATELGVYRIVPIFTERSVVHLDGKQAAKKVQHWRSIVIAACEQSGRNRVPQIDQPIGFYELLQQRDPPQDRDALQQPRRREDDLLQQPRPGKDDSLHQPAEAARLLLSPTAELRLADIPQGPPGATVLIGPEGGLADIEQEAAIKSGYTPVRLGPRVLRTETAAVCALTLLQQRFGDL
jgi:16S rRNA (uracil1498-N3)-methyltransferase